MMLVLQAGGFGAVVLDLADAAPLTLRQFPHTTWMRLARAVEGSPTVAVLVGAEHLGRSAGGATVALAPPGSPAGEWCGEGPRARRLAGIRLVEK